jgi:predicted RNA-binding protein (TIGR00451 family)
LRLLDGRRKFAIMLDYQFGRGTGKALPRGGLKFFYSRRSDRLKQVTHRGELFATIRPNGAIALSMHSASILISSKAFLRNSVTVRDEAAGFVREGKSVFCKFVVRAGSHVLSGGEVVVLDEGGNPLGVGRAKLPGAYMGEFNAGVAVKVRSAHQ